MNILKDTCTSIWIKQNALEYLMVSVHYVCLAYLMLKACKHWNIVFSVQP